MIEEEVTYEGECHAPPAGHHLARQSPDQLQLERVGALDEFRMQRIERRKQLRQMQKQQIRDGMRPRRRGTRNREVVFATVNATCANSLKKELLHGTDLRSCDIIFLQEHGLRGEARVRARRQADQIGWDACLTDAYVKNTSEGGGTGVLTQAHFGVRPLPIEDESLEGRATAGIGSIDEEVTAVSWYGVSGAGLNGQLAAWERLALFLKSQRRPFIVGGDLASHPARAPQCRT